MLPRKIILFSGLLLLLFVSFIQCQESPEAELVENDEMAGISETARQRSTRTTTTGRPSTSRTTRRTTTDDYPHVPYDPKEDKRSKKRYGKNRGNGYDRSDEYDNDRYEVIGDDGVHPGEYGQDVGDFGPVYTDQEDMYASMTVWIRAADDWENPRYQKKYGGKKYNKNKDYKDKKYNKNRDYKDNDYKKNYDKDDNDYKKNDRSKRSYSRVDFPVRQYKDIHKFPHRNFPPLISIFPWLPIFYDKITYQTFIFSPTGGIYILPPLINFYGRRFAVAQLIKWGYASLVSSGAPPPPNVNVAPLVQPVPAAGPVPTGVAGGQPAAQPAGPPAPRYDSQKNRFVGGVKTDFPDFKPRYSQTIEERGNGYGNDRSVNQNAYGGGANYGGTGRQEVYARGGSQTGGASYGGAGQQQVYPRGGPQTGGA